MDIAAMRQEYMTTPKTLAAVAKKYGVALPQLKKAAAEWPWQKRAARAARRARSLCAAEQAARRYRAKLYALAEKLADRLDDMVSAQPLAELLENKNVKLRDITGAVKDIEDALHLAGEADLAEQAARVAKLRRDAAGDAAGDGGVTVHLAPECEALAE